jgi:hypothetical protein
MKELTDDLRARRELEMARTEKVERPWKKHGVMPV